MGSPWVTPSLLQRCACDSFIASVTQPLSELNKYPEAYGHAQNSGIQYECGPIDAIKTLDVSINIRSQLSSLLCSNRSLTACNCDLNTRTNNGTQLVRPADDLGTVRVARQIALQIILRRVSSIPIGLIPAGDLSKTIRRLETNALNVYSMGQ